MLLCHLAQLLSHLGSVLLLLLHELGSNLVQKLRRTTSPRGRGGVLRRGWGAPRSPRGESLLRLAGLVGAHLDVGKGVRH